MEPRKPSALDDYLFDLNGYVVIKNAVGAGLLARLNEAFDNFPNLDVMQWWGNAQRRDYTGETGFELHNVVEVGEPFEELIDHPGWIEYLKHWCGDENSYTQGLFIDEAIASIRRSGGHHPAHSGGFMGSTRGTYNYRHGQFRAAQVNVILALRDVGEGDGPTMLVPGSHKANLPHPLLGDYIKGERMDTLPGAIPIYCKAGDALLFADGIMHGGSSRTNPSGERRVTIYRYGVSWAATRFGFEYSQPLLDRLTPSRRRILQPITPIRPPAKV